MKKRKFEGGGPTDDGIERKRGLRSGTGELVLDSQGMPILTVGKEDQETKDAIAKAKLRGGSDTPPTKRRNFLSRLFNPRFKEYEKLNAFEKQNREDEESFASRKNVLDNLIESVESSERGGPRGSDVIIGTPRLLARKKGGSVTRGDGIAKRGKTKGRYI